MFYFCFLLIWCSILLFTFFGSCHQLFMYTFDVSLKKSIVQLGPIFPFSNCFNIKQNCHKMRGGWGERDSLHTIFPNKSNFDTMLFPIKQGTNPTLETTPNRPFSFHLSIGHLRDYFKTKYIKPACNGVKNTM